MGDITHTLPIIGDQAPDFEAQTTHGPVRLSDFKGKKWVVLFSHPADFTPVCTTEFIAFSSMYDEFVKLNVHLMGLSIDSVHSHLAWVNNLKEKMGVKVPFPIIADLDMKVARLYGMIHGGSNSTTTIRAVFFIDDKGVLRAMIYYPMSNGRYIPEILRLVRALQTSDKYGVATPANWQPGEKVVVPAPATTEALERRLKEGYECKDWYLCFKNLG
jgi:peroxiredoxin (alkyl hydroperoxide reductase subunit C)